MWAGARRGNISARPAINMAVWTLRSPYRSVHLSPLSSNSHYTHHLSIFKVIRGLRKENENLVPDVVKNIKETISLPCDFKVDERVEEETEFIWLKEDSKLDTENSKYSLLPNKSLLIENITLEDPGLYTCNVVTPLQSVRSSIQLIVSGESPEIINNFEKITIHEGETLGEL